MSAVYNLKLLLYIISASLRMMNWCPALSRVSRLRTGRKERSSVSPVICGRNMPTLIIQCSLNGILRSDICLEAEASPRGSKSAASATKVQPRPRLNVLMPRLGLNVMASVSFLLTYTISLFISFIYSSLIYMCLRL